MKRDLRLGLALALACTILGAVQLRAAGPGGNLHGYVERGGVRFLTKLTGENAYAQGSYPTATVTVYIVGTTTLAPVWSDRNGTAKANPFTADSSGFYNVYVPYGCYSLRFSGGGLPLPQTVEQCVTSSSSLFDVSQPPYNVCNTCPALDNTNGIQRAISDIKTVGGGVLYFPRTLGTFEYEFDDLVTSRVILFPLPSNTEVLFELGARMKLVGSLPQIFSATWGVDQSVITAGGTIDHLQFRNLDMLDTISYVANCGDPAVHCYQNVHAISLEAGDGPSSLGAPTGSVSDVVIDSCKFDGHSASIWAVQAGDVSQVNLDQSERQIQNVHITNNYSINNTSAFVVADGDNFVITDNTAAGDSNYSANAVAVHCGQNIRVSNNHFSNYTALDSMILIRDRSYQTGGLPCGTKHVLVANNDLLDSTGLSAITIATAGTAGSAAPVNDTPAWQLDTLYGVQDVSVTGNIIKNCGIGVNVVGNTGADGTPFRGINITGNDFQVRKRGIAVHNTQPTKLSGLVISSNNIRVTPATTGTLTGVITVTGGSTAVTGYANGGTSPPTYIDPASTIFTSELKTGDWIETGGLYGEVKTVNSNTSLTLYTPWLGIPTAMTNVYARYYSSTDTALTGTVTFTTGSKNLAGVGTSFKTQLYIGAWIKDDTSGVLGKIGSITDDTTAKVLDNWAGATETVAASRRTAAITDAFAIGLWVDQVEQAVVTGNSVVGLQNAPWSTAFLDDKDRTTGVGPDGTCDPVAPGCTNQPWPSVTAGPALARIRNTRYLTLTGNHFYSADQTIPNMVSVGYASEHPTGPADCNPYLDPPVYPCTLLTSASWPQHLPVSLSTMTGNTFLSGTNIEVQYSFADLNNFRTYPQANNEVQSYFNGHAINGNSIRYENGTFSIVGTDPTASTEEWYNNDRVNNSSAVIDMPVAWLCATPSTNKATPATWLVEATARGSNYTLFPSAAHGTITALTPAAGTVYFCTNCNPATSPCTAGGAGALIVYNGTNWSCP